jgi:hypothetical protein
MVNSRTAVALAATCWLVLGQDAPEARNPYVDEVPPSLLRRLERCAEDEDVFRLKRILDESEGWADSMVRVGPGSWVRLREYLIDWIARLQLDSRERVANSFERFVRIREETDDQLEERILRNFHARGANVEAERLADRFFEQGQTLRAARIWNLLLKCRADTPTDQVALAAKLVACARLRRWPGLERHVIAFAKSRELRGVVSFGDVQARIQELVPCVPEQAPCVVAFEAIGRQELDRAPLHRGRYELSTLPWKTSDRTFLFNTGGRIEIRDSPLPIATVSALLLDSHPVLGCCLDGYGRVWANQSSRIVTWTLDGLSEEPATVQVSLNPKPAMWTPPVAGEGVVYAGWVTPSSGSGLTCFDWATREVRWNLQVCGAEQSRVLRLFLTEHVLLAVFEDGHVGGIEASSGRLLFLTRAPGMPVTRESLCLATAPNGQLLVPDVRRRRLWAFDVLTLKAEWLDLSSLQHPTWDRLKTWDDMDETLTKGESVAAYLDRPEPEFRRVAFENCVDGREIEKALKNDDETVRLFATIQSRSADKELIAPFLGSKAPSVRRWAAFALACLCPRKAADRYSEIVQEVPELAMLLWLREPSTAELWLDSEWASLPESARTAKLILAPRIPKEALPWLKNKLCTLRPEEEPAGGLFVSRASEMLDGPTLVRALSLATREETRAQCAAALRSEAAAGPEAAWGVLHGKVWPRNLWSRPLPRELDAERTAIPKALALIAVHCGFSIIADESVTPLLRGWAVPMASCLGEEFFRTMYRIDQKFAARVIPCGEPRSAQDLMARGEQKRVDEFWGPLKKPLAREMERTGGRATVGMFLAGIAAKSKWRCAFVFESAGKRVRILPIERALREH